MDTYVENLNEDQIEKLIKSQKISLNNDSMIFKNEKIGLSNQINEIGNDDPLTAKISPFMNKSNIKNYKNYREESLTLISKKRRNGNKYINTKKDPHFSITWFEDEKLLPISSSPEILSFTVNNNECKTKINHYKDINSLNLRESEDESISERQSESEDEMEILNTEKEYNGYINILKDQDDQLRIKLYKFMHKNFPYARHLKNIYMRFIDESEKFYLSCRPEINTWMITSYPASGNSINKNKKNLKDRIKVINYQAEKNINQNLRNCIDLTYSENEENNQSDFDEIEVVNHQRINLSWSLLENRSILNKNTKLSNNVMNKLELLVKNSTNFSLDNISKNDTRHCFKDTDKSTSDKLKTFAVKKCIHSEKSLNSLQSVYKKLWSYRVFEKSLKEKSIETAISDIVNFYLFKFFKNQKGFFCYYEDLLLNLIYSYKFELEKVKKAIDVNENLRESIFVFKNNI